MAKKKKQSKKSSARTSSRRAPSRRAPARRRGCCSCSGFLIRALIALVLVSAIVIGGGIFAYDKFAKPMTGLEIGEAWKMVTSLSKTKEADIVTNPYDSEADLASFITGFKSSVYIKDSTEISLEDILTSFMGGDGGTDDLQNMVSSIELDTERMKSDLTNAKEGAEYQPKVMSITDKQVAALINNLIYSGLTALNNAGESNQSKAQESTLSVDAATAFADEYEEEHGEYYDLPEAEESSGSGEDKEHSESASGNPITDLANSIPFAIDPQSLSVAQVIIDAPNGLDKKDVTLKVTLKVNLRAIADSFINSMLESGEMEMPVDARYVKIAYKIVRLILPKKTYVSMGVKPFDEDASAEVGLNSFDEEQLGKLNTVLANLSAQGVMEFDLNETLQSVNSSVVEMFKTIDEYVDLIFVDSSISIKPIETILKFMQIEDVTEADLVSILKALLIVDADAIVTDPYVEGSTDILAKLKSKYAINSEYELTWNDILGQGEGIGLTNLVDNVSLKNVDFDKTNQQMKVAVTGKDLTEIVAHVLENMGSSESSSESAMPAELKDVIKLEQFEIAKDASVANRYSIKAIVSADVKAYIRDAVESGMGARLTIR